MNDTQYAFRTSEPKKGLLEKIGMNQNSQNAGEKSKVTI